MVRKKQIMIDYALKQEQVFNDPDKFKSFLKTLNFKDLILEVGCGKGAYVRELALRNPNNLYIGIDVKADRLGYAVKIALEDNLENVIFLNVSANTIEDFFTENSIDQIWITFADPHPKPSKAKKRLTHENFLKTYFKILKNEGIINLKTDSDLLYNFSKEEFDKFSGIDMVKDISDLYDSEFKDDALLSIKTPFEIKHLKNNLTIKYVKAIIRK